MPRRRILIPVLILLVVALALAGIYFARKRAPEPAKTETPKVAPVALPDRDEIRKAVEAGVQRIIELQSHTGSWKAVDNATGDALSETACTALATLALLNAQRHVVSEKVQPAIHKGLSFITQRYPEPKTRAASFVLQALYKADPTRYTRLISMYGWMLVMGQITAGSQAGGFGRDIVPFPMDPERPGPRPALNPGDASETLIGALGLDAARRAGFQVPRVSWFRLRKHFVAVQRADGGWGDPSEAPAEGGAKSPEPSKLDATLAGALALSLADGAIYPGVHDQCKPPPVDEPLERALAWLAKNFKGGAGLNPYGWYACERLGTLTGYSEFGGVDWYAAGAARLLGPVASGKLHGKDMGMSDLAFGILFLSRGIDPVAFNKLKRAGDWSLHPHDLARVADYLTDKFCYAKQWRIVTLDAPVEDLLRVPILWVSGHEALRFADGGKRKLKDYVDRGGTILAEACCGKEEFDNSFRALVAELWPEQRLEPLPPTHRIYDGPRRLKAPWPRVLGLALPGDPPRLGVIYLPDGISCRWERGGVPARPALDLAANIHFFVEIVSRRPASEGQ